LFVFKLKNKTLFAKSVYDVPYSFV